MPGDLGEDRLYLTWGGVLISVAAVMESEAVVQFPFYCEAGISGTHRRERLTNQPHGVLNCVGLYLTATWGDVPCLVLPYKGIDGEDWVPVRDK